MHNNTRSVAETDIPLPKLHTVRGQVALPDSTPLTEVEVSVDGLTSETDEYGNFSFLLPDGEYTANIHVNSTEIPGSVDFVIDGDDVYFDLYDAYTYIVRGRLVENGFPLAGIQVSIVNEMSVTDENGYFRLEVKNGSYTIEFDIGEDYFPDKLDVMVDADVIVEDVALHTVLWEFEVDNELDTQPVPGPDGTIYFVRHYDYRALVAVKPDGTQKWLFMEEDYPISAPSIDSDGTIYISCWSCIRALNPDGTLKWLFPVEEYGAGSAPVIGKDGTLYFGCSETFYALGPDGSVKWKYNVEKETSIWNSPSVGPDGTIYYSCSDHHVYALNPDGSLKWKYGSDGTFGPTPAIGKDGTIYVGGYDRYFHAINPDGTLKWKYEVGKATIITALIDDDGTIIFPNRDQNLYALNPDGTLKWKYSGAGSIEHPIAMRSNGEILAGESLGYLYAFNNDGSLKWSHQFENRWIISPAFAPDGTLYITMNSFTDNAHRGYLCAIQLSDDDVVVHIDDADDGKSESATPIVFSLGQNYPNPFNPVTTISFTLPHEDRITLIVYNVIGKKVETLADNIFPAGKHNIKWDAGGFSSGIYFCRIEAGKFTSTKKLMLIK